MSRRGAQWHGTDCPAKPWQLPSGLGDITTHIHTLSNSRLQCCVSLPPGSQWGLSFSDHHVMEGDMWSRKIYCAANVSFLHSYIVVLNTIDTILPTLSMCYMCSNGIRHLDTSYRCYLRGKGDRLKCCQNDHSCKFNTGTTWELTPIHPKVESRNMLSNTSYFEVTARKALWVTQSVSG